MCLECRKCSYKNFREDMYLKLRIHNLIRTTLHIFDWVCNDGVYSTHNATIPNDDSGLDNITTLKLDVTEVNSSR